MGHIENDCEDRTPYVEEVTDIPLWWPCNG